MKPPIQDDRALHQVCSELQGLCGGIADTSTLIYLDTLEILEFTGQWLDFLLIPQVVAEFGHLPPGMQVVPAAEATTTDKAVLQTALALKMPVFSEDGQLLRRARYLHHPHYNCLMLLTSLYARGIFPEPEFQRLREDLLSFARYSHRVVSYADQVLHTLLTLHAGRSSDKNG